MKRLLIIAVLCLLAASAAQADGHLGIFGDPDAINCYPMDDYVGLLRFYLVLIDNPGTEGIEFTVSTGGGFVGTFLGDELGGAFVAVGNSPTGKAIGFGGCLEGNVHVLTLSFYCQGLSETCSYLEVLPYSSGELRRVTCDFETVPVTGGKTFVNHDGTCVCEAPGYDTSPVQHSTWGGVKALYAAP